MNDFIEILLGACMEFVPEIYREEVLAIACPVYVGIVEVFVFALCLWFARAVYSVLVGRGRSI